MWIAFALTSEGKAAALAKATKAAKQDPEVYEVALLYVSTWLTACFGRSGEEVIFSNAAAAF
jgi:hypothetical protein